MADLARAGGAVPRSSAWTTGRDGHLSPDPLVKQDFLRASSEQLRRPAVSVKPNDLTLVHCIRRKRQQMGGEFFRIDRSYAPCDLVDGPQVDRHLMIF